jgi:hypothetical protein
MPATYEADIPSIKRSSRSRPAALAEIAAVPKSEAGKVLTTANIWIATGLTLLPILTGFVGLFGGAGLAMHFHDSLPWLAGACGVLGLLCAVSSVTVLVCYQQFLPGRFMRSVARGAFSLRSQPLVDADDPEAVFLDIVPRTNWGQTMMEPASDVGFWRIDRTARELHFEGDRKRYRIPFDAVMSCEVEAIRMQSDDWGTSLYYATVLMADTPNGLREIPLCGRHLEFRVRRMPQRRAQAEAFCDAIWSAIGRPLQATTNTPGI